MDTKKTGRLIAQLRKEKGLTQSQLANELHISSKTVSKWECGYGVPDASVWAELAKVLKADIPKLLSGELSPNRRDAGKIDMISFYVCPVCGNILTSTGKAGIACCGRTLSPLYPVTGDETHKISIEEIDIEYYINISHEMTKNHYLAFAAYVYDDRMWFQRFYPEQGASFRMPVMRRKGNLYLYCVKHGLFKYPFTTI